MENMKNKTVKVIKIELILYIRKWGEMYKNKLTKRRRGETWMQVTDVRIRKITTEGKMKAIVSVTFDDEFVVHDIKIIEGQNGLFIAMPSRKMGEGDFRDIAHPINSETRNKIQYAIFAQYEKMNELERAEAETEEAEIEEVEVEEETEEETEVERIEEAETGEAETEEII